MGVFLSIVGALTVLTVVGFGIRYVMTNVRLRESRSRRQSKKGISE